MERSPAKHDAAAPLPASRRLGDVQLFPRTKWLFDKRVAPCQGITGSRYARQREIEHDRGVSWADGRGEPERDITGFIARIPAR